jgi:hypothetical protein
MVEFGSGEWWFIVVTGGTLGSLLVWLLGHGLGWLLSRHR